MAPNGGPTLEERKLALEEKKLEADNRLRQDELQIRREELAAQRQKGKLPILLPLWVAALGFVGNMIVAGIQGYFNMRIEKAKFQSSVILKAIETGNVNDSAKNLRFLVKAGLLDDRADRMTTLLENPASVPVLPAPIGSQGPPLEPGVVDVARTDTVELSCEDPEHPEALVKLDFDGELLYSGLARERPHAIISGRSPGPHTLRWLSGVMSSTLTCEVVVKGVNGEVRYRNEASPTGSNNGSVLLRVQ